MHWLTKPGRRQLRLFATGGENDKRASVFYRYLNRETTTLMYEI